MKKLILLLLLVVAGCGHPLREGESRTIERVFMHEPGRYSVLVREYDELKSISFRSHKVKLLDDVEKGDDMWMEMKNGITTIHIHNAKEVEGGAWQTTEMVGETIYIEDHSTTPVE
ncbi:MAG: hypothetical protein DWQ19_09000 [Crenarchaeota archaeon]|nr:MAG: hypothetical protein DWQ19_09000 [Thermoproteota archaeon]